MNVNSISNPQWMRAYNTNTPNNLNSQLTRTQTSAESTFDRVTISEEYRAQEANWKGISEKYDVTNISERERYAMGDELFNAGLISSDEHLALSAPVSLKRNVNGDFQATNQDEKINYLQFLKNDLEMAKHSGYDQSQIDLRERLIDRLDYLQKSARS